MCFLFGCGDGDPFLFSFVDADGRLEGKGVFLVVDFVDDGVVERQFLEVLLGVFLDSRFVGFDGDVGRGVKGRDEVTEDKLADEFISFVDK